MNTEPERGAVTGACNIAAFLPQMARERPDVPAIWCPVGRDRSGAVQYVHETYADLDARSDAIARGLVAMGITRGTRTVLMVPPSPDFFALTFALFKAGIVPVMVDPGMGTANLKMCLAEARPEAFIGIPKAHAARVILGWGRGSVKKLVTVGSRWFWGGRTLAQVQESGTKEIGSALADTAADEVAAILFTSGSTGVPKGAIYHHGNFVAQVDLIRDAFGIEPGEIDLPTFPLFALFDPALGMTTVVPDMDFTRPGSVDPTKLVAAIEKFSVTNVFGSPAVIRRLGRWGEGNDTRLPSLRRVISAGAPMPPAVLASFCELLGDGVQVFTPYGATEALPVSVVGSDQVLGQARPITEAGGGVCIGAPLPANDVRIIEITDEPLETWDEVRELPVGEVGEIVVKGPTVTKAYFGRDASTKLAKIRDSSGGLWHRMGDIGRLDESGDLWFWGRKSHRVQAAHGVMFTVPCEAVFDTHPDVLRTALVGVPSDTAERPVLCVELEEDTAASEQSRIRTDLLAIAQQHEHTRTIEELLFHPAFPVDIRHNAKIFREKLRVWAAKKLGVRLG